MLFYLFRCRAIRFITTILVVAAFAVGSSPGQSAGKTPEQIASVHSRLFRKGPAGEIPNLLSQTSGDLHVACVVPVSQQVKLEMYFTEELALLASGSDLVVLGKAEAGTTHVNADEDFLYTDWKFTVEEVLKDNPNAPVQPGNDPCRPARRKAANKRAYGVCQLS